MPARLPARPTAPSAAWPYVAGAVGFAKSVDAFVPQVGGAILGGLADTADWIGGSLFEAAYNAFADQPLELTLPPAPFNIDSQAGYLSNVASTGATYGRSALTFGLYDQYQGYQAYQETGDPTARRAASVGTALQVSAVKSAAATPLSQSPILSRFASGAGEVSVPSSVLQSRSITVGLEPQPIVGQFDTGVFPARRAVTRNFGGASDVYGHSWTTDPVITQSRNSLGLPAGNTAEFRAHGTIIDSSGITTKWAGPIPEAGVFGGGSELLVPSPRTQIRIDAVTMPDRPMPRVLPTDPRRR